MNYVGLNIKRLRLQKGLSLRAFAKEVNISASMISQIENNKTSPSLSTLKNIADELETTIGQLIDDETESKSTKVVKASERKSMYNKDQGIRIELLSTPDPFKQMEPLFFQLDKEASSGKSYKHYGQEFLLVLKGKLEITLIETKYILSKGDSIYFNSSISHSFRNLSSSETEVVWVVTPPSF